VKANFRQFFAYDCEVVSSKNGASLPDMETLAGIWTRHLTAGLAKIQISNNEATLAIGDIRHDAATQTLTILIRHSDKAAAESVYSDLDAGTFTPHPKAATEGGETGIHLIISLKQERDAPNRYACVLEKAAGLDLWMVRRLLNRVIHNEYDSDPNFFKYDSPIGQRDRLGNLKRDRCLPRLEFDGRPSATLARDIDEGKLSSVKLIRSLQRTAVGGSSFLHKEEATIRVSIDHGSVPRNAFAEIKRALHREASDFPQAQIGFTLPNSRKTVSVKLDSANGHPLSDMYIKSFDVTNIFPPLAYSSQNIVNRLASEGVRILLAERST
jgi:hypothetical protein